MIVLISKIIILTWFITEIPGVIHTIKDNFNIWKLLKLIVTCMKCLSFWITLVVTQDIFIASATSWLAWQFDKHLNKKGFEL